MCGLSEIERQEFHKPLISFEMMLIDMSSEPKPSLVKILHKYQEEYDAIALRLEILRASKIKEDKRIEQHPYEWVKFDNWLYHMAWQRCMELYMRSPTEEELVEMSKVILEENDKIRNKENP